MAGSTSVRRRYRDPFENPDLRRYVVGENEMASTVFVHLPSEGELKTACACLHPVTAMAMKDLLNATWMAHGCRGSMPHEIYFDLAGDYNENRRSESWDAATQWQAVYLNTATGRRELVAVFRISLDAVQYAERWGDGVTTEILDQFGDAPLEARVFLGEKRP